MLLDDVGTVAHVWFDGVRLRDTCGNAWMMNGTVPQVARNGQVPAGAGPFSAANYYSLSGSALDFAGDFSACLVSTPDPTADQHPVSNDPGGLVGYVLWFPPTGKAAIYSRAGSYISTANSRIANVVNVACFGRSGGNIVVKLNLGPLASTASAWAAAGAGNVRLGRGGAYTAPLVGSFYEFLAWNSAASDALFTALAQRVKQLLGITAW